MDPVPPYPVDPQDPAWQALLHELRSGLLVLTGHTQVARRRLERGHAPDGAWLADHLGTVEACAARLALAVEALADGSWRGWHEGPPPPA